MKKALRILLAIAMVAVGVLVLHFVYTEIRFQPLVLSEKKAVIAPTSRVVPSSERNVYFGELHLHTSYSMDANLFGTKNDPRAAYRFAKGEEIELPVSGLKQRLIVPLDFAAVTDHAEGLGAISQCSDKNSGTYWSIDCIGMRHQILLVFPRLFKYNKQVGDQRGSYNPGMCGDNGKLCIQAARTVWQDTQSAANEAYEPGRFTTFIGFEYSPTLDQGGMLHRNIIFRGDVVPDNVFTSYDGFAEDLLRWLDNSCKGDCQALSIPHNPNFSWGLMFGDRNSDGTPVTRENLALRARYEKLVEIFQAKGSSECARGLGNNDEQCGFENLWPACKPGEEVQDESGLHARRCVAASDMLRTVLRKGLLDEAKLGFNPYKFGIVAATDNHNGAPGDTTESTYKGHASSNDYTPELRLGKHKTTVGKALGLSPGSVNPGGLTGVWAEQNTREAIFDAMQRRETFGTSGTRIRVRLFGSFGFKPELHHQPDMLKTAYANGVPMGGDLRAAQTGKAPSFLVAALRDPNSAALQRIQIVKGWVAAGESHERVYDVACSDGLSPDPQTQHCGDNGAKVTLEDCSISKNKGAAMLSTTWMDPDFRPDQAAFYYARVLENPTCRYSTYDTNAIGAPPLDNVPATIQERAWTSPIWYEPAL